MEHIVDIQGFYQANNDYILKELAIVPVKEESEPLVFLFKPPFAWRKLNIDLMEKNEWLKFNHHGIPWGSGNIPYTQIGKTLREYLKDSKKVIVKGSIIKEWLQRFKFNVHDINEMGFPEKDKVYQKKLLVVCPHHVGAYKTACAVRNVKLLKKLCLENVG